MEEDLLILYRLFVADGGVRSKWIERLVNFDDATSISSDDERNVADLYERLFRDNEAPQIEMLYFKLLNEMKGNSYDACSDVLGALVFLQHILAVALWRYRMNVCQALEEFTREFDRLDVPSERIRLYTRAQGS
jgi:hypothetical protein